MRMNKTILFGAIVGALYGVGGILAYILPPWIALFFLLPAIIALLLGYLFSSLIGNSSIMIIFRYFIWIIVIILCSFIGALFGSLVVRLRKKHKKNETN